MYAVGKKFSVADGVISSYEHPPVVELGEVKRSPVKKRVSIKGKVNNVSINCKSCNMILILR